MDVLPAIDLIGGKCVRLVQGDYAKQINYNDDPVAQAAAFVQAGANWLHIVDLDGAKSGSAVNHPVAAQIIRAFPDLKIELGGGIRTEQTISSLLEIGIRRLILGSKAIKDFDWFSKMAKKYPNRLVLGLDARDANLASEGWMEKHTETVLQIAQKATKLPISAIVYTDISKDGMLSGPNLDRTAELIKAVSVPVIAAGGVTTVQDIKNLKSIGAAGAIIGRALYEGTIHLKEAIEAAR